MELQVIQKRIHEFRGFKVMLDYTLAELYEVETRVLKQAVKRNLYKFPADFMFELEEEEIEQMVSQFVIPSRSHLGGAKPMAFTEHGVAMLSTILKSRKAIEINIAIIRAFVEIRKFALSHSELTYKLNELEKKFNKQFRDISEAINYLLKTGKQREITENRVKIGFKVDKKK